MRRVTAPERPNWKDKAETLGFVFHTMYGEPYWDESAYYQFSLRQIENDLEDPSAELYALFLDVVERALQSEELMRDLAIPEEQWDVVKTSYLARDPSLYGRYDFSYNGTDPAKLLEFNADTPTSLYETGAFQWIWLDDQIAAGLLPEEADQFNSLQDQLLDRFKTLFDPGSAIHFSAAEDTIEDRQTVRYLEDIAAQAGMIPHFVTIDDIGIDAENRFCDDQDRLIQTCFKLYPWEDMVREDYGQHLFSSDVCWLEPPWKMILSNKAILPLLWRFHAGHPNLLPAYFEGQEGSDLGSSYVKKPIFSREGANVSLFNHGRETLRADGDYGEEGYIIQSLAPLPVFGDNHTVIGSWMVGDQPAGIGIREDKSPVTQDLSRFLPHIIRD